MSKEEEEIKPLTGRTVWDFASEVTQRLGLSILILIGIAFGFYQYQNQALKFKEAEQKSNKDLQDKLNSAQEQLVNSAVAVGQLNTDMIDNIKSGLEELQKLRDNIKTHQEQAKAEAKKANDAILKQKEAEEATERAKNNLEKVKLENEKQQKRRTAKSGSFKDKVRDLISLIDKSDGMFEIKVLAKKIRGDHLVEPNVLFQAVAKNINAEYLEKLSDLEGVKYDAIQDTLKDKTDFATWVLVREEGKVEAAYGVVRGDEKRFLGFVVIEFDDKERIWSIDGYEYCFLLVVTDYSNWDNYYTVVLSFDSSEPENLHDEFMNDVPSGWPQGRMNLTDMIYGIWAPPEMCDVNNLSEKELSIVPITLDELQSLEPLIHAELLKSHSHMDKIQMMERKSKTFSAAPLVPITLGNNQKNIGNLRSTIIQTLDAAVRRDTEKRQNLARENFSKLNWGHLALMVLNNFAVRELTLSPNGLEASITCSFQDYTAEDILTARMNFRREQAVVQSPWFVTGFVTIYPESKS